MPGRFQAVRHFGDRCLLCVRRYLQLSARIVKTVSDPIITSEKDWTGPLYLDASALVKLYLAEPGSDALDAALRGRSDLMVSDLAITEIVSAIARRRREGVLPALSCVRLHRKILADIKDGLYIKNDLMPEVHREAERLLLAIDDAALRAADALHLALASLSGASAIVTYDLRLAEAAIRIGLNSLP
jgi:predicted nucleic acid-binding protein